MNQLIAFTKDFWEGQGRITIHDHYCSPTRTDQNPQQCNDVIDDIVDAKKPMSAACIPIAKQISRSATEQLAKIRVPKNGDVLIGILHQPIIERVTFTLQNYCENIEIEATLVSKPSQSSADAPDSSVPSIWVVTQVPIPLICIGNYEDISIEVTIHFNSNYNNQTAANQDTFKALYGYCSQAIQYQLVNQLLYELPLVTPNTHTLEIVCGIWRYQPKIDTSE